MGVSMVSDRAQSLHNDNGTETEIPGSKIFQMSDAVLASTVGCSGLTGITYRLIADSILTSGVSRTPVEDAQYLAGQIVPVIQAAGRTMDDLTQNAACGLLSTLDDASDGAILAPFKSLPDSPSTKKATSALSQALSLAKDFVSNLPADTLLQPFDVNKVVSDFVALSNPSLVTHLGNDIGLSFDESDELTKGLAELYAEAFTKRFGTRDVGILTMTGYGPKQIMPSIATLTVVGAPGGQLIYSIEDDDPAKNGVLARICTPGQDSAQQQLIHGIDPGDSSGFVGLALTGAKQTFAPSDDQLKEYRSGLETALDSYFDETYTQPFLRVVRCLDEPGLARVADLLGRVQELRSVASNSQSTVGGVLEVATITKRGGIRWHRRSDVSLNGDGASVLG
jgi:hypothetical protein